MATAAALSKLKKRVLVLEQHYVPGGFTHAFKRRGWTWDVGVHVIGDVDPRTATGRVLADLTCDRLRWASLGEVYDEFHYPDLRIDFPNDRRWFADNLHEAFPSERRAIDAYLERVHRSASVMRPYWLTQAVPPAWAPVTERLFARASLELLSQRTADVMRAMTSNERLIQVLTGQWGYYGLLPERSSFGVHALCARHYLHGGYYPVGGAPSIAEALLRTVADAGGWTRVHAPVEQIVIASGRAVGVRLASGEEIRAGAVVSAAGALPTVTRLLPPEERQAAWARSIASLSPSVPHLCLYLGFRGDIQAAGARKANQWFHRTWERRSNTWDIDREEAPPMMYASFPSLKDPDHDPGPSMLHTGELVTFVPYERFAAWREGRWRRRGEDYDALKKDLADRMLAELLRHSPALGPMVAYAELSTPLSTEHFARAAAGAVYGLEATPERYQNRWLRPRTPVPGLFMSGCDVSVSGVMGAMTGGLLAALAMDPLAMLSYLRRPQRR